MIVRISGEDQYRLADEDAARLNELENAVVAVVEGGRRGRASTAPTARCSTSCARNGTARRRRRARGLRRDPAARRPHASQEAGREFTGEGLIPD